MRSHLPKKIRGEVKAKFGGRCGYCGEKHEKLCIDHVHPVAMAHHLEAVGKNVNDLENLMPACFSCNNYKSTRRLEEFRRDIQGQVYAARRYSLNFRLAERYGLIQAIEKPIRFYFETTAAK